MSEDRVLQELSVENVRRHVEHIVREIPYRAAGSENGRRMAEYSRDALLKAGITNAVIHELPAIVSFPQHAEFRVESPTQIAIQANTMGHSLETMAEGLSGELVYVGSGSFDNYDGKDVRGKIILTELSYSPARQEKQRIAGLKGAIGAVMMNWGHPENEAVPFGSVKPVWGNPTPDNFQSEMVTIPCIGITRAAGLKLKDMCARGPVRVWLRTHVTNGWRPVQFTVGEIPVSSAPGQSDFILVGGHQDSWPGEAATDNAAGNACVMELARVFKKHEASLRRGLMFGFWTAHETGTMAGSAWFADRYWNKLRDHGCAYIQIDQPACTGTTIWHSSSNSELKGFHQRVEQRLLEGRENPWRPIAKNGDASFFGIGIPMMRAEGGFTHEELKASALSTFGWWHHSIDCTIDKVNFGEWMQLHLRIYAAYLWELCTAPVLPFTYGPVAASILERLKELERSGTVPGLDHTIARARNFAESTKRFDQTADVTRAAFNSGKGDENAARLLDRTMKRMSRLLVPLQSTAKGTYGHDPYGYTPQTTLIPCLYDVPRLASMKDGEERWMLETKVVRDCNRVADALSDASALIDDTLAQIR